MALALLEVSLQKQPPLWGKVPLPLHRFDRQAIALRKRAQVRVGSLAQLRMASGRPRQHFFGSQTFNCPGFVGLSLGSTIASTSAVPGDSSAPLIAGTTSSGRSQR